LLSTIMYLLLYFRYTLSVSPISRDKHVIRRETKEESERSKSDHLRSIFRLHISVFLSVVSLFEGVSFHKKEIGKSQYGFGHISTFHLPGIHSVGGALHRRLAIATMCLSQNNNAVRLESCRRRPPATLTSFRRWGRRRIDGRRFARQRRH